MSSALQGGGPRVNLLGRPSVDGQQGCYRVRSRKTWALLAYLVLTERPSTRSHLASLLFADADDPLGALRWGLSEIRRALAGVLTVGGDPVVLRRHDPDLVFDVDVVAGGSWAQALSLPSFGAALLEGMTLSGVPVFESWLLAEQRRLAAASNAVLRAAADAADVRADYRAAIGYAVRRLDLDPLDEDGHAQLIRLYQLIGDDVAARQQYRMSTRLFEAELGVAPGPSLLNALETAAVRVA